jgi:hypothetical protein
MDRPRLVVLLMVPIGGLAGLIALLLLQRDAPRGSEASPQPGQALALQAPAPPVAQPERVAQAPTEEGAPAPQPEAVLADEDTDEAGTEEEIDFLPYPNNGEEDFAAKYGPLSAAEIYGRLRYLNEKMSAVASKEAQARWESGRYAVQEVISEGQPGWEQALTREPHPDKPVGQGNVWPCSRVVGMEVGHPELQVTYLTEMEYPELFAMQDEYLFAARSWAQKDEAQKAKQH